MDLTGLLEAARDCGIGDVDSIRQLARPAAVLRPNEAGPHSFSRSRIGGVPALPSGIEWPRRDGRSLAFIAQIDLASQPRALADEGLPTDGMLLFFYDAKQSTWGFDPKDAGSFAVIHIDAPGSATAPQSPSDLPEQARYRSVFLDPEQTMLLPPSESVLVEDLELGDEQLDAYQNLLEQTSEDDEWSSRCLLGGYPDQIQGDMTLECAIVAAGLYCGDATAYKDPRLPAFRREARNWRLLLQVPSVESAGMMWGDAGCLYYWIHEDDLKGQRFDRSWMILQCS